MDIRVEQHSTQEGDEERVKIEDTELVGKAELERSELPEQQVKIEDTELAGEGDEGDAELVGEGKVVKTETGEGYAELVGGGDIEQAELEREQELLEQQAAVERRSLVRGR